MHTSGLWDNLRGMMYKSQARIARMQAAAAVVPPEPLQKSESRPRESEPVATTPMMPMIATTWFMPTPPPTTTVATTKERVTTTVQPCTTIVAATAKPVKPIEINVDVDQNVKNHAGANSKGNKDIKNVKKGGDMAGAPAAVEPHSPGMVPMYAPSPAGEALPPVPTAPGDVPKVEGVPEVPAEVPKDVPKVEGVPEVPAEVPKDVPKVETPEGVPKAEVPKVEAPPVR